MARKKRTEAQEARRFGWILPIVLGVIAGVTYWRGNPTVAKVLVGIGVAAFAASVLVPALWLRFFKLWMKLAEAMGFVMTRVLLGAFFFIILTPFGLVMRLFGRDAANAEHPRLRHFDEEQRLVGDLRGDGDREHTLVDVLVDLLGARAQADFDLRRFGELERLGRTGVFERQILDVDLLDRQLDGLEAVALCGRGGERFGHGGPVEAKRPRFYPTRASSRGEACRRDSVAVRRGLGHAARPPEH